MQQAVCAGGGSKHASVACAVIARAFTPATVGFRAQVEVLLVLLVLPAHLSLPDFPGRWHVAPLGKHLAPV